MKAAYLYVSADQAGSKGLGARIVEAAGDRTVNSAKLASPQRSGGIHRAKWPDWPSV